MGKSLMGRRIILGGRKHFGGGTGFLFGYFSGVESLMFGVLGEPLQGAASCWGFLAWGPGFLTVS